MDEGEPDGWNRKTMNDENRVGDHAPAHQFEHAEPTVIHHPEEDLTVLAYRFEGDKFCKAQRFAAYTEALGERFLGRVLPDSAANTDSKSVPEPDFKAASGTRKSWIESMRMGIVT